MRYSEITEERFIPPSAERKSNTPLVDTPEFKSWFAGSKVVNEDGSPCVCVHAASTDFGDTFDRAKQRFGKGGYGFYFSSAEGAARYSDYHINYMNDVMWDGTPKAPHTIPVFLQIKNPLYARSIEHLASYLERNQTWGAVRGFSGNIAPDALTRIEQMGYDGVITTETLAPKLHKSGLVHRDPKDTKPKVEYPVFIVFRPNQIKSLFNKGSFDPGNDAITETVEDATPAEDRIFWLPVSVLQHYDVPSEHGPGDSGWNIPRLVKDLTKKPIQEPLEVGKSIHQIETKNDHSPYVFNGNHRLAAARRLEMKWVPCWAAPEFEDAQSLTIKEIEALGGKLDDGSYTAPE